MGEPTKDEIQNLRNTLDGTLSKLTTIEFFWRLCQEGLSEDEIEAALVEGWKEAEEPLSVCSRCGSRLASTIFTLAALMKAQMKKEREGVNLGT